MADRGKTRCVSQQVVLCNRSSVEAAHGNEVVQAMFPVQNSHWLGCRSTVGIADIEKATRTQINTVTADRNRFENLSIPPQRDNDELLHRRQK
jgi:hypothetical protein